MLRVIAGRFGGRRLKTPRGDGTRPTADRVKEALFSVLGNLSGAKVLDLFAGTGSLGIESLSRGASAAVFVESSQEALAVLQQNLRALGLGDPPATVIAARVERSLARLRALGPYDLVLADAPYADTAVAARAADELADAAAPGATLVIEHDVKRPPECTRWRAIDRRAYGTTGISIFEIVVAEPAPTS